MSTELRRFLRIATEYRVEYGPFPFQSRDESLKPSVIKNIGGGGLLFVASDPHEVGRQLVLKIYVKGWRLDGDDIVESPDSNQEVPITAIAEVTRCDRAAGQAGWSVGVRFLGRILS